MTHTWLWAERCDLPVLIICKGLVSRTFSFKTRQLLNYIFFELNCEIFPVRFTGNKRFRNIVERGILTTPLCLM